MKSVRTKNISAWMYESIEIGHKFGALELLEKDGFDWTVKCACGKVETMKRSSLLRLSGARTSCGCRAKHSEARVYKFAAEKETHDESTLAPDVYKIALTLGTAPEIPQQIAANCEAVEVRKVPDGRGNYAKWRVLRCA